MKPKPTTPTLTTPTLIFVNATTETATIRYRGEIVQSEIQPDQDGELYYLAGGKAQYLPKEWQPKAINS